MSKWRQEDHDNIEVPKLPVRQNFASATDDGLKDVFGTRGMGSETTGTVGIDGESKNDATRYDVDMNQSNLKNQKSNNLVVTELPSEAVQGTVVNQREGLKRWRKIIALMLVVILAGVVLLVVFSPFSTADVATFPPTTQPPTTQPPTGTPSLQPTSALEKAMTNTIAKKVDAQQ